MISAATVAVIAAVSAVALSGAQATQAPTAAQLLKTALGDATASSSVHEVESGNSPTGSGTVAADVGARDGRQDITHSGGEKAHVLLIGSTAYLSGNQAALIHYFGFPAAIARKVGTRWVSVPSSSGGYSVIAAGATLASAIKALTIPGHASETAPATIDGQSVVGIRGKGPISGSSTATVTATIYVSRTSRPLPLRAVYDYSAGGSATIELSDWNERLTLTAPTNVIPEAQLKP